MKLLKILLIGILALLAILAILAMVLPNTAHVERSIVIDAPQANLFALTNGFARFNDWSPWAEMDPATRYTYSGPDTGVGARMEWASDNPNVGNGSQEISVSQPYDRVESLLDFGDQGKATAFFQLTPEGDGTKVVWGFHTTFDNVLGRFFGPFMDGMLGPDYEKGLAKLKTLAEGLPKADWTDLRVEMVETESMPIAYVSTSSTTDSEAIGAAHAAAYGQIAAFLKQSSLEWVGPPLTINTSWGEDGFAFDAAATIAAAPEGEVPEDSPVQIGSTYGGQALKVVHIGSYDGLEETYEKAAAYLAVHGHEVSDRSWSVWVNDPTTVPEDELETHIFFPVG